MNNTTNQRRLKSTVCIIGGSGFVGRRLSKKLVETGHRVTIICRRPQQHRDLQLASEINLQQLDVYDGNALTRYFKSFDIVINLVGILNESGHKGDGFEKAHVELTRTVVDACQRAGISRYLHMSALNADPNGASYYLRSKGTAEDLAHKARTETLNVTSIRPSVIFGPDDSFINRFAGLLRLTPVFPLACANARFQPVYIENVVDAFSAIVEQNHAGKRYNLCGPTQYTLREIVEYVASCAKVNTKVIALGDGLSRLQGRIMDWVPGKPFSTDNYNSTKIPNVCNEENCTNDLQLLGIQAVSMEQIVPAMFERNKQSYDSFRQIAGR